ncbi:MAG: hypothetical protein ACE5JJ_12465 [Nitrospinota bacterium]
MVALILGPASAQEESIPGVPDRCCGYADCREAETALLSLFDGKARVEVDGVTFEVERGKVVWSNGGWYCSRDFPPELCADRQPRAECARCVVVTAGMVALPEFLVMAAPPGASPPLGVPTRKLLVPARRACAECHR